MARACLKEIGIGTSQVPNWTERRELSKKRIRNQSNQARNHRWQVRGGMDSESGRSVTPFVRLTFLSGINGISFFLVLQSSLGTPSHPRTPPPRPPPSAHHSIHGSPLRPPNVGVYDTARHATTTNTDSPVSSLSGKPPFQGSTLAPAILLVPRSLMGSNVIDTRLWPQLGTQNYHRPLVLDEW